MTQSILAVSQTICWSNNGKLTDKSHDDEFHHHEICLLVSSVCVFVKTHWFGLLFGKSKQI